MMQILFSGQRQPRKILYSQFIHGKTRLIKGFSELNNYLSEGDEVVAILPDSLAYGKAGRNGMPGGATLIYKPYIVRSVSEPEESTE